MKFSKRCISILLAVVMIASFLPNLASNLVVNAASQETPVSSINQSSNGAVATIDGGYSAEDRYVVMTGCIKATGLDRSGWKNSIVLGVSGETKWNNYAFQFVYGTAQIADRVKLNTNLGYDADNTTAYDGVYLTQEQSQGVNLAKAFDSDGLAIKVVRFNTWAYLMADFGTGFETIGRMYVPEEQSTQFTLYNGNTAVRLNKITVATGEETALAAFDDSSIQLTTLKAGEAFFPVDSTTWTLQAKVTIPDYAAYTGNGAEEYFVKVGADTSKYMGVVSFADNSWRVVDSYDSWKNATIDSSHATLLNPEADGMWVRWIRNGADYSIWTSIDGENWSNVKYNSAMGTEKGNLAVSAGYKTTLTNVTVSLDGSNPSAIEQKHGRATTPVSLGMSTGEKYAVMSAHLQATQTDAASHSWTDIIMLGVSGYANWTKYGMQILYQDINANDNNLVKLLNGYGNETVTVVSVSAADKIADTIPIEQYYKNVKLEKVFTNEGMDVKVVRLNTMAYLLADMGEGFEQIGRMYVPEDQPTQFSLFASFVDVKATNVKVESGKDAAIEALNDMQMRLDAGNTRIFDVEADRWVLDTEVVLDTPNANWKFSYGLKDSNGANNIYVRTALMHHSARYWYVVPSSNLRPFSPSDEPRISDTGAGGSVWLRYVRDGSHFSVYSSSDGVNYTFLHETEKYFSGDSVFALYTDYSGATVKDFRFSYGDGVDVASVEVTTLPKTNYFEGDTFETDGMVVTLTKKDGTTETVSLEKCKIEVSESGKLTVGDKNVTVSYLGFTDSFQITVAENSITNIEIVDMPYITSYRKGDTFDASGATYMITYANGNKKEHSITTAMCSVVDTSTAGDKIVAVIVDEKELTFTVTVEEDAVMILPDYVEPEDGGTVNSPIVNNTTPILDGNTSAPKTGDSTASVMGPIYGMLLAATGMAVVTLLKRRKKDY